MMKSSVNILILTIVLLLTSAACEPAPPAPLVARQPVRGETLSVVPQTPIQPATVPVAVTISGFRIEKSSPNTGMEIAWKFEPSSYNGGFNVTIADAKAIFSKTSFENNYDSSGLGANRSYAGRARQTLTFNVATLAGQSPGVVAGGTPYEVVIEPRGIDTGRIAFALDFETLANLDCSLLVGGAAQTPTLGSTGLMHDVTLDTMTPIINPGNTNTPSTADYEQLRARCLNTAPSPTSPGGCPAGPRYCQSVARNSNTGFGCQATCGGVAIRPATSAISASAAIIGNSDSMPTWAKVAVGVAATAAIGYGVYSVFSLVDEEAQPTDASADTDNDDGSKATDGNSDANDTGTGTGNDDQITESDSNTVAQYPVPYVLFPFGDSNSEHGFIVVTANDTNSHSFIPYLQHQVLVKQMETATDGDYDAISNNLNDVNSTLAKLSYRYTQQQDAVANFQQVFGEKSLVFSIIQQENSRDDAGTLIRIAEVARYHMVNPYIETIKGESPFRKNGRKQFFRFYSDSNWPSQKANLSDGDFYGNLDLLISKNDTDIHAFINCIGLHCSSRTQ